MHLQAAFAEEEGRRISLRTKEALAEKISIAPGPMFSTRQSYRNFIRISCGEPWSPKIERAIGVLAYLVKQMR